jgi:hypothetical protein
MLLCTIQRWCLRHTDDCGARACALTACSHTKPTAHRAISGVVAVATEAVAATTSTVAAAVVMVEAVADTGLHREAVATAAVAKEAAVAMAAVAVAMVPPPEVGLADKEEVAVRDS